MNPSRARTLWLSSLLLLLLPLLVLISTGYSETGRQGILSATRMLLSGESLSASSPEHEIFKLRLLRALCAAGVGGSLALAGAMSQGLFRNPLAAPDLLGIGSGAMLGAVLAIAFLGGYGPDFWMSSSLGAGGNTAANSWFSLGLIPVCALVGALVAALTIYRLATRGGRISIPTLLLTGLAINAMLGAVLAALQALLLQDWQVSRAIIAWAFGTLDDRTPFHLLVVWSGAALALLSVPFVGLELDLMAGGEEDAAALGADPVKVKTLVLICVALATASSVAVSGQIAFVGLLVPHLMRSIVGPHHRALLPVSFLAGAVLLVSVLVFQHGLCPYISEMLRDAGLPKFALLFWRAASFQPGVLTSMLGAPFFLYLLMRQGKNVIES